MLTETGGGNMASCVTYVCQELAYVNANSDVYLGYTGVSNFLRILNEKWSLILLSGPRELFKQAGITSIHWYRR
jgi:hypothetical protein